MVYYINWSYINNFRNPINLLNKNLKLYKLRNIFMLITHVYII